MKDIDDLPLQAEMEHIDTTTCKKVLEWMDVHQKGLPRQFRKTVTDAQRPEHLLRNKFKYLKRKTDHAPEVRALLDQIQRRTTMDSATTTCKKVLEWMDVHNKGLQKEIMKPTTDAQRAEYILRNKLK